MNDFASAIKTEGLRRLYDYWIEKRGNRRYPARTDIYAHDIAFILGWINLIDVFYDPLRFRFRLHGSMLVENTGTDMTGKFLEEHPKPQFASFLARSWKEVVDRGQPTHHLHDQLLEGQVQRYESLRLPLSSDGAKVDMLLIAARHRTLPPGS